MSERTKPKRSDCRKRSLRTYVRMTPEEREIIEGNASACGLSVPEFLRRLGKNERITSTVDKQALLKLLDVHADLGRLGGLLKLWLSNDPNYNTESIRLVGSGNVRTLLKELQETHKRLEEMVLKL